MSKTMYFLRKRPMDYIEHKLSEQFDLKLCFKNKTERIFKNNDLLVACRKKYIFVLVYNDTCNNIIYSVINLFS